MRHVWLAAVIGALGCSSTQSSTGSSGPIDAGAGSCPYVNPVAAASVGAPGAQACEDCLTAQCASPLAAYVGSDGCGDYVACVCPKGLATGSAAVVNECQNGLVESGCVQAATDVELCEDTSCSTACSESSTGLADGGDASVVSTGGSFLDASLSATCERYATCCERALEDAGPASTMQMDCQESASLLTDAQCEAYLVAYQDAGLACTP
jgi:hypothetical protein